jgi:hypothetical protein
MDRAIHNASKSQRIDKDRKVEKVSPSNAAKVPDAPFSDGIRSEESEPFLLCLLDRISAQLLKHSSAIFRVNHHIQRKGPQNLFPFNTESLGGVSEMAHHLTTLFIKIDQAFPIRVSLKLPVPENLFLFIWFLSFKDDGSKGQDPSLSFSPHLENSSVKI